MLITPSDVDSLSAEAVARYRAANEQYGPPQFLYGVPRGGVAVAYKIAHEFAKLYPGHQVPTVFAMPYGGRMLQGRVLVVDDIVDSGETIRKYNYRPTLALLCRDASKAKADYYGADLQGSTEWVQFPWDEEGSEPKESVTRILEYLGYDPRDPSLLETPRRFLSWLEEFKAEQDEPEYTIFSGITYDQMVLVKDIPFTSLCEHHLLPFTGIASVGYIPEKSNIVGLSKVARIVQWRAKKLQVQERMTQEILDSVSLATSCSHVGVVVKAEHSCMSMRGPKVLGHSTITSALLGDFKDDSKTREEFLKLAGV